MNIRLVWLLVVLVAGQVSAPHVIARPAPAQSTLLIGTWQLLSAVTEEIPSGSKSDVYGANPNGFINYSPEGRMMALIVRSDRQRPAGPVASAPEAEALFRGMLSYTGT